MPDSNGSDVEMAVEAASRAFPSWSQTPAAKRAELLCKIADEIERRLDEFALVSQKCSYKNISQFVI